MLEQDFAVILFQGKQYKVSDKDTITVDNVKGTCGDIIDLDTVFTFINGKSNFAPTQIQGEIIKHNKSKKILVLKFKRRKGYKVLKGHRSLQTQIKINLT